MSIPRETLLTLAAVHAALAISPGPNTLIVLRSAIHERKLGIIAAAGVWPAGIIWAILAMFGLGAILTKIPQLTRCMYFLCGCYLAWLGIKLVRKSFGTSKHINVPSSNKPTVRQVFAAGFISNVTNPKGTAYWMSIFTATNATAMPVADQIIAIVMMPTISFIWYCFLSFIVARKAWQHYLETKRHWIDRLAGLVMIGFGAKLLSMLVV